VPPPVDLGEPRQHITADEPDDHAQREEDHQRVGEGAPQQRRAEGARGVRRCSPRFSSMPERLFRLRTPGVDQAVRRRAGKRLACLLETPSPRGVPRFQLGGDLADGGPATLPRPHVLGDQAQAPCSSGRAPRPSGGASCWLKVRKSSPLSGRTDGDAPAGGELDQRAGAVVSRAVAGPGQRWRRRSVPDSGWPSTPLGRGRRR